MYHSMGGNAHVAMRSLSSSRHKQAQAAQPHTHVLQVLVDLKFIARRHVDNGAYPASSFVLSGVVAHIPVALVESLAFCSILYWMAGLAPEASRFFYFYFECVVIDVFFR